jgi:hypothetical protein
MAHGTCEPKVVPWHMTILDTQTWLRGEVPRLWLTNVDVSLLRGWIVISGP